MQKKPLVGEVKTVEQIDIEVKVTWPEKDRKKVMKAVESLNKQLEKAGALADALAQKMKEIEIEVTYKSHSASSRFLFRRPGRGRYRV